MNLLVQYHSLGGLASTRALASTPGFASIYDEAMSNAAPPLDGLVVLDFTRAPAGPYGTILHECRGQPR
jgi:hypothetical protein